MVDFTFTSSVVEYDFLVVYRKQDCPVLTCQPFRSVHIFGCGIAHVSLCITATHILHCGAIHSLWYPNAACQQIFIATHGKALQKWCMPIQMGSPMHVALGPIAI